LKIAAEGPVDSNGLPLAVDWSNLSPVKNQGSCGACWAFTTVAWLESAHRIFFADEPALTFSEQ
jgi:C1A family cysteine protease